MKTDFYLDVALAVVLFALLVDVFAGGGHYATYLWAAAREAGRWGLSPLL